VLAEYGLMKHFGSLIIYVAIGGKLQH